MYNHLHGRDQGSDKIKAVKDPVMQLVKWIKSRPANQKALLGVAAGLLGLLLLYFIIEDHDVLFILAETCHIIGIGILIVKLHQKKSASGLSLRSQVLTAVFLGVRLYCSFMMEYDIHTFLDLLTVAATAWVIYTMYFTSVYNTWQSDKDSFYEVYVLVPCMALALLSHPQTRHIFVHRVLWAFCVYCEAVSVLPQLRMMQQNKVIEKFTGHYVFALGMSRFFSCAHWILQMVDSENTALWTALGSGVWPIMVLLSEVVQTFILADFCYYYVNAYARGIDLVQLPAGIV